LAQAFELAPVGGQVHDSLCLFEAQH